MAELNTLTMTIELLGGLALFLHGMEKMTDSLKATARKQMVEYAHRYAVITETDFMQPREAINDGSIEVLLDL
mgnify:CR=1 FL=1